MWPSPCRHAGLVRDPVSGWHEERGSGLARGMATGVVGLFVKPMVGALEFASKTASGVGGGIRQLGDEVGKVQPQRKRPPVTYQDRLTSTGGSLGSGMWVYMGLSHCMHSRH